jgi:hypothetical protein
MGTVEYDCYGQKIIPKYCPLTGERILGGDSPNECIYEDCSAVKEDVKYLLYGHAYRCKLEKRSIEVWHEKREKAAALYKRLNQSLTVAQTIDVDKFFAYCDSLDKEMIETRQEYCRDMILNPYHEPDEKCLIYLFEDDRIVEILLGDNPYSLLSNRYDWLTDPSRKIAVNCCSVPTSVADAINVRVHLNHGMDVKAILHADNPVYIKARSIGKYVDAVYGWEWLTWKRVRDRHLELKEIVNYDNILYIKPQLDEIIRREYPPQKDKT